MSDLWKDWEGGKMRKLIMLAMVLVLSGCGLSNGIYINYNFNSGVEQTTTVGSPMLDIKAYCKNEVYGNIITSENQQLIYSGKTGTVIRITYREFSNLLARPAFSQDLTYDLSEDKIIAFRNTRIRIEEATNSNIRFVVLESPAYKYVSGTKVKSVSNCLHP